MLSTLGKISADDVVKYFSYLFPENRLWKFKKDVINFNLLNMSRARKVKMEQVVSRNNYWTCMLKRKSADTKTLCKFYS